jgi:hypothetical protein
VSEREENLQPEVDDRRDSILVEGDDADHVLPPPELDPYTPEPGARPGDGRAFSLLWVAIAIVLLVVALVVYAAVR